MYTQEIRDNLRHNFTVNVMDANFFGFGLGLASSVTIVPLFVNSLTNNTVLIGLIASIQLIGWQLPQILTSARVASLKRYLPMVLMMTLNERLPYFVLALVALALPLLGSTMTLILTFILLCWQAIGGGLTATAWQSMIAKIIPPRRRGTFWGIQGAGASVFKAAGSFIAGLILVAAPYPYNFALCFFLTSTTMMLSWLFLARTKEPEHIVTPLASADKRRLSWQQMVDLLRRDANIRAFMVARMLVQFAWMAVSFFTIYGIRRFDMDEATAGAMFGLLTLAQTFANPLLGWMGDWWGHRRVFALGAVLLAGGALTAMLAPSAGWLYLAFIFAGLGNPVMLTIVMTITVGFGTEAERPYYIGLTNSMTAPATLFAPLIGGWLADMFGFGVTFGLAAGAGVATALVLLLIVRDPEPTPIIAEPVFAGD